MLLTCQAAGWPIEGYLAPEHPLQKALAAAVADVAGEEIVATAVDGCGAPLLGLSLTALARGFLRLVDGTVEADVADAMRANPDLVSGRATTESNLMRAVPGMLVKAGAEGVMAVAVPGAGAVAIKMDDGAHRGNRPVLVSALRRIGVTGAALEEAADVLILGGGAPVGEVRSLW
jgi:L-asparaginase II